MGNEEKVSLDSIFKLLTHFDEKAEMFPLIFTKVTGSNKSRKHALGTIIIPQDIATEDIRPIYNDWVFMCFAFPKEEYKKYMLSGGDPNGK